MHDPVLDRFLRRQHEDGLALARASDVLEIVPHGAPPDRYLVRFSSTGLVRSDEGVIVEAHTFVVGVTFPADYLRVANPFRTVTWLAPGNVWHPNIDPGRQAICIGHLTPGTGLVDVIYQCWEIITWNRVTMREDDALNSAACEWARNHRSRIPADRRALTRGPLDLAVRERCTESGDAGGA